ncbi:MAG: hypothetical protein AAGI54_13375 [Planctomycetota bacterium]
MSGKSEFACHTCGRRYAWKPALAGKKAKCKCGVKIVVPETDPAAAQEASFAGFELDLPDDAADIGVVAAQATPDTPTKCIACNHPLKPGAVICMNCGTDQRTGEKIQTGVQQLDAKERRSANLKASLPVWGLRVLQIGILSSLAGVTLFALSILLGVVGVLGALFTLGAAWAGVLIVAAGVCLLAGIVFSAVGPILCLAVPGEASARGVLIAAVLLVLAALSCSIAAGLGFAPPWVEILGEFLNLAGVLCFMYFLWQLAKFLDFGEITDRAEKLVGVYAIYAVLSLLAFVPFMGWLVGILILGYSIYATILYIGLLIDLNNAIAHRIRATAP